MTAQISTCFSWLIGHALTAEWNAEPYQKSVLEAKVSFLNQHKAGKLQAEINQSQEMEQEEDKDVSYQCKSILSDGCIQRFSCMFLLLKLKV